VSQKNRKHSGLFIALEGIHGAGKSTQTQALGQWLRESGFDVVLTREVGGTALAEHIRSIIQIQGHVTKLANRKAMLFLVMAARASHVTQVIRPALNAGKIVVSDRYEASTYVYQHFCDHLGWKQVAGINNYVTGGLSPDLTILLDLPVEIALGRKVNAWFGQAPREIFQYRLFDYHQRAREAYLELAATHAGQKHRWAVVDCRGKTSSEITDEIISEVDPLLKRRDLPIKAGLYQLQLSL
jgi:dTMP kinase